jgi:hypothetical protein
MTAADERAQVEYVAQRRDLAEADGHRLTHVLILSSHFAGDFAQRAEALAAQGVTLCYLRASDLVRLALEIEAAEEPPSVREAIPWPQIMDAGQPGPDELDRALTEARAAAGGQGQQG